MSDVNPTSNVQKATILLNPIAVSNFSTCIFELGHISVWWHQPNQVHHCAL